MGKYYLSVVMGEICITGGGLCKGYLNKPETNKEKFLYNDNVKEVIYKSGDLGFYATDGRIGYMVEMIIKLN